MSNTSGLPSDIDIRIHYGSGLPETYCGIKVVPDKVFETTRPEEVSCKDCRKALNKRKAVRIPRYVGG